MDEGVGYGVSVSYPTFYSRKGLNTSMLASCPYCLNQI